MRAAVAGRPAEVANGQRVRWSSVSMGIHSRLWLGWKEGGGGDSLCRVDGGHGGPSDATAQGPHRKEAPGGGGLGTLARVRGATSRRNPVEVAPP